LRGRPIVIGLGVLGLAVLPGCYASTEPATEVGPETAKLNAHGTANNGPASAYFRYWLTGAPDQELVSDPIHFPAGATGPFSKKVGGLAADSEYTFKVCGADDGAGEEVCAQTRTFTTAPAVEDSVVGGASSGCCFSVRVDARAGPNGESARGTSRYTSLPAFSIGTEFTGFVTCLAVDGRSAAVGAIGQLRRLGAQDPGPHPASMLMTVVDGHLGPDSFRTGQFGPASPAPDCASASFENHSTLGQFIVNDAEDQPSSAR
jgi:hypothetical protein